VIRLRRLAPGDRVALVAPASSFPPEEVEAGVAELARLGLEAVYDPSIFDKERFVAGSVQTRVDAIHKAWADPAVAALIAVRGGYGSAQLLPLLDTHLLRSSCKPLIGYSDITALLSLYLQNGMTAIHLHPGSATGVLAGGTLTQLMASMGTPWAFDPPADCVLFLEDIGERPYRIHRLLTQAAQSGVFARARAIVFGEFPGCDEAGGDPAIKDVLREFTADFRGPVLFNFPSGHTSGPTWTLPFGVSAEVVGGPAPVVRILEAAVQ
jgi:muramoyltetrapeptide carboxypeptidase